MNILICPDKFKGTLTSEEVAKALRKGIQKSKPEAKVTISPLADGGEGTLEIILKEVGGRRIIKTVKGPYGRSVKASYIIMPSKKGQPKTAFIEMAQASGLKHKKRIKRPVKASTYGTGQLITSAINSGCRKIYITLGGSATTDAGIGALRAIGVNFYNRFGGTVKNGGSSLNFIKSFSDKIINKAVKDTEFIIATDVDNPFYGLSGAVRIYAKQKGANPSQRERLERGFKKFAKLILKEKNIDLQKIPGTGAAGGLAGGLIAFLPNSKIIKAFDLISEMTGLEQKIKKSDLVITGEGRMDEQTLHGKVPFGVLQLCKKNKKKILAINGSFGTGWPKLLEEHFWVIYNILGERAFLRKNDAKPLIYKPFHHKIPIKLDRMDISKRYGRKKSKELIEFFIPLMLEDFLKGKWVVRIRPEIKAKEKTALKKRAKNLRSAFKVLPAKLRKKQ